MLHTVFDSLRVKECMYSRKVCTMQLGQALNFCCYNQKGLHNNYSLSIQNPWLYCRWTKKAVAAVCLKVQYIIVGISGEKAWVY